MTKTEVLKILSGRFADPKDKKYWMDVLKEIERKEKNYTENKKKWEKGKGTKYPV